MRKQKWISALVVLLMVGSAAAVLAHLRTNQKLGKPGVTTEPSPDSSNLEVVLPEKVLDYTSEKRPQQEVVLHNLPNDTSFGQRLYTAADGFQTLLNVVLMGSDRTSIHKPQYCLTGAGFAIDDKDSGRETIRIEEPRPYDLPVMRIVATKQSMVNGKRVVARGVYVYWFVADDALSGDPSGAERMWMMAKKLLRSGTLQRWAYVSYFAVCPPGQEEATYDRMKKLIVASVPKFQLTPEPTVPALSAQE